MPSASVSFGTLIRGLSADDASSFVTEHNGQWFCRLDGGSAEPGPATHTLSRSFFVEQDDLKGEKTWLFCFDCMDTKITGISITSASIAREEEAAVSRELPKKAVCRRCCEFTLLSEKDYADPLSMAEIDAVFTHESGASVTVPGFWDGGNVWRIRFAPSLTGKWSYTVTCSDPENPSLTASGNLKCTAYKGDLEIYRRGSVRAADCGRYFVYGDGTPFFYLGDTHWGMPTEGLDDGHFQTILDRRAEQGFTVIQSEPIGAKYCLSDGLTQADIGGFRELDRYFAEIADRGFVHANAALFFSNELVIHSYSEEYLTALSRYWIARYSAYPVIWTTAQECDNDFYYCRGEHTAFDAQSNPWKIVFAALTRFDPYSSPASAHMEFASTGDAGVRASTSSFAGLPGYSWYAAQYSPSLTGMQDWSLLRDFYDNPGGKPVVNYEGRYVNLWTGNYGGRAQGWISYLNGMCGYGYGAADIWLFNSTYDMNTTSSDGYESITPEDKAMPWTLSLELESARQVGYMRRFFESVGWETLIPSFGDRSVFEGSLACDVASRSDELFVIYLRNLRSEASGRLHGLPQNDYTLSWFDPRSGEYVSEQTLRPDENGDLDLGSKPAKGDWVALVRKTRDLRAAQKPPKPVSAAFLFIQKEARRQNIVASMVRSFILSGQK